MAIPIHYVASPSFSIGDVVNATIGSKQVEYINYPFNTSSGVTIKLTVISGKVAIYTSAIISTPNEAFYDAMVESGIGYADLYLSPAVLCNISQTVYIAIVGGNSNSSISISVNNGDVSVGMD